MKRMTPESLTGRVFGFNISAMYIGVLRSSSFPTSTRPMTST